MKNHISSSVDDKQVAADVLELLRNSESSCIDVTGLPRDQLESALKDCAHDLQKYIQKVQDLERKLQESEQLQKEHAVLLMLKDNRIRDLERALAAAMCELGIEDLQANSAEEDCLTNECAVLHADLNKCKAQLYSLEKEVAKFSDLNATLVAEREDMQEELSQLRSMQSATAATPARLLSHPYGGTDCEGGHACIMIAQDSSLNSDSLASSEIESLTSDIDQACAVLHRRASDNMVTPFRVQESANEITLHEA